MPFSSLPLVLPEAQPSPAADSFSSESDAGPDDAPTPTILDAKRVHVVAETRQQNPHGLCQDRRRPNKLALLHFFPQAFHFVPRNFGPSKTRSRRLFANRIQCKASNRNCFYTRPQPCANPTLHLPDTGCTSLRSPGACFSLFIPPARAGHTGNTACLTTNRKVRVTGAMAEIGPSSMSLNALSVCDLRPASRVWGSSPACEAS